MTPYLLLDSIDCDGIEKALLFVDGVEVVPLLSSGGGVRQSAKNPKHFVIVLNDYHKDTEELLETFVHEVLHIVLFVSFPLADHEEHHPKIREIAAQSVKGHHKRIRFIVSHYLSEEKFRQMTAS